MSFGFATSTSMIGGLLDSIIKPFQDLFNILITAIQYGICALLYTLQVGMFWIIDMVQSVFRRVAGLEPYWYKQDSGNITSQDGDIVESFLHSDLVWNIFTSVLIAAIILLFVTTIMAILKTEVNEKDNAKGPVFKQALKAIAYFAIVPVVCLFGVSLANIFLRSFDKATSVDGATSISGQVFAAASYNSNRVRNGQQLAGDDSKYSKAIKRLMGVRYTENGTTKQTLNIKESSSQGEVANAIDSAFINGYIITIEENNVVYDYSDKSSYMAGYGYLMGSKQESFKTFDKTATSLVYYYYDLLSYNYLIGYLASATIIFLLLNLMIGVVQRLFDLTVLFVVSPAFIATMPLDEGSRYKKWREKFVEKTLACYGPIVGINLAFTILTLVQRIYIFDPDGGGMNGLFNVLMQCIFVIVAILCVKDFGKLVNGLVGGSDLNDNKTGDFKKKTRLDKVEKFVNEKEAGFEGKIGSTIAGLPTAAGVATMGYFKDTKNRREIANAQATAVAKRSTAIRNMATEDANAEIESKMSRHLAKTDRTYQNLSEEEKKKYVKNKIEKLKTSPATGANVRTMHALGYHGATNWSDVENAELANMMTSRSAKYNTTYDDLVNQQIASLENKRQKDRNEVIEQIDTAVGRSDYRKKHPGKAYISDQIRDELKDMGLDKGYDIRDKAEKGKRATTSLRDEQGKASAKKLAESLSDLDKLQK